jgi:hypothetical protein
MKIIVKFNSRKNYVSGLFDVYHVSQKTTIIDIWRISVYLVK